jgi:Zn-dependent protease
MTGQNDQGGAGLHSLVEVVMSIRVGRVLGVPIEIHATWFIALILLSYTIGFGFIAKVHNDIGALDAIMAGALATVLLFACIIGHELAHVAAARRCGINTGAVSLFMFGGAAKLNRDPDVWGQELSIALAGPAVSLALAGLFLIAYLTIDTPPVFATITFYLAFANGVLGLANLLPGYPLDGGRALKAVIWRALRDRTRASRVATIAGQCVGLAAVGYGLVMLLGRDPGGLWLLAIGWYVADSAARAWEQEQVRVLLEHCTAAEIVTDHPAALSLDDCGGCAIAEAGENAWELVERVGELDENASVMIAEGRSIVGVVEKRELPRLLTARLHVMAH